jgi:hypothetical protein
MQPIGELKPQKTLKFRRLASFSLPDFFPLLRIPVSDIRVNLLGRTRLAASYTVLDT